VTEARRRFGKKRGRVQEKRSGEETSKELYNVGGRGESIDKLLGGRENRGNTQKGKQKSGGGGRWEEKKLEVLDRRKYFWKNLEEFPEEMKNPPK